MTHIQSKVPRALTCAVVCRNIVYSFDLIKPISKIRIIKLNSKAQYSTRMQANVFDFVLC